MRNELLMAPKKKHPTKRVFKVVKSQKSKEIIYVVGIDGTGQTVNANQTAISLNNEDRCRSIITTNTTSTTTTATTRPESRICRKLFKEKMNEISSIGG